MSESMRAELARLRAELAETRRSSEKQAADAAKRSAIGMALACARVSDPNRVFDAIAAKVTQDHFGRWVVGTDGVAETGPDEGCTYSIDRLVADIAGKSTETAETAAQDKDVGENPFRPGATFNITAQMVMLRNDPERAEHLQYLVSIGK